MAEEKNIYLYDLRNALYSLLSNFCPGAVLTVPIESFDRTPGCTGGVGHELLRAENIGKFFNLSILDPVIIDAVEFIGSGEKYIPEAIYKKVVDLFPDFFKYSFFVTFKQGNEYIIVDICHLDVKPLF